MEMYFLTHSLVRPLRAGKAGRMLRGSVSPFQLTLVVVTPEYGNIEVGVKK